MDLSGWRAALEGLRRASGVGGFWGTPGDYQLQGESPQLRQAGEKFLREALQADTLDGSSPLLVDFGCWSGRHLPFLERVAARAGARDPRGCVIGIDQPWAHRRLAEARRAHAGFTILGCGIERTGLPDSSVDGGVCWRVLHNLTREGEWTAVMGELRRVLKHDAPLVVAVRAAHDWMEEGPVPIEYHGFTRGADRRDLYFSKTACLAMFPFYGFKLAAEPERFREAEFVNGQPVENLYWLLLLVTDKEGQDRGGHRSRDAPQPDAPQPDAPQPDAPQPAAPLVGWPHAGQD